MDTEIEFEAYSNLTNIQKFFYGQNVFITGVTGLVGKVVMEKILRSCPGVGKIYILMRPKRGLSMEQRLEKMLKTELFRNVREVFPKFQEKLHVIEGDITTEKLGISIEDYDTLCQTVNIVIHSAASVNFNDPLSLAVNHNLRSTKYILDLCHAMPNLKVLVHVSTAFVKREKDGSVLEVIPKQKLRPHQVMEALEWMDKNCEQALSDFLTEKFLTTYLVTKAMAEALIEEEQGNLPIAIIRPTYVSPTYKDPFPGWVDNLQGLSGLLLAGAKGVLRTLASSKTLKINIIPVDFVSNAIIAGAWLVGTERSDRLFIANAVMDYEKLPYADEDILNYAMNKRTEFPLASFFRYPSFTIYYNTYAYRLHALVDHWIPALFVDLFLYIFTGRTILLKVYSKIDFLYGIFYKLGRDPWICRHENLDYMRDKLSEEDGEIFSLNTDNFDWPTYMDNCFLGGRKYLAKEDPSNIPYAKKKAFIWWLVTSILKWCIIIYVLYYIFNRSFFTPVYTTIEEKVFQLHS